jgi:hypothetical protein
MSECLRKIASCVHDAKESAETHPELAETAERLNELQVYLQTSFPILWCPISKFLAKRDMKRKIAWKKKGIAPIWCPTALEKPSLNVKYQL